MNRAFEQAGLLAVAFFGMWFLLSQVDFLSLFHAEEVSRENERRIAEYMLDALESQHELVREKELPGLLPVVMERISGANDFDGDRVTIHVVLSEDVNAFALPDSNIVLTTGLIGYCETPEELAGVLAHEAAHIRHGHVMRKLIKELGLLMVFTLGSDQTGSGVAREVLRTLSSTAFDREQETEADTTAFGYLVHAEIDPEGMAALLLRLSREKDGRYSMFELISTHPHSADRAAEILDRASKTDIHHRPIVQEREWKEFKKRVRQRSENE